MDPTDWDGVDDRLGAGVVVVPVPTVVGTLLVVGTTPGVPTTTEAWIVVVAA